MIQHTGWLILAIIGLMVSTTVRGDSLFNPPRHPYYIEATPLPKESLDHFVRNNDNRIRPAISTQVAHPELDVGVPSDKLVQAGQNEAHDIVKFLKLNGVEKNQLVDRIDIGGKKVSGIWIDRNGPVQAVTSSNGGFNVLTNWKFSTTGNISMGIGKGSGSSPDEPRAPEHGFGLRIFIPLGATK